jgi:LPXTG-motif cell wall-anchored protein
MPVAHPKLLRALGVVSIASGALLLAGALPAFAVPGLTASGTGTVMTQLPSLIAPSPATTSPQGVAVANGITYVTNPPTHSVLTFDSTGAYLADIGLPGTSPFPTGIVASPDGGHVYVTDGNAVGSVFSINTSDDTVATFGVAATDPYGISLSPDGSIFYIISNGDAQVYAYATSNGSFIANSTTDNLYEVGFHVMASPDGTKVYETMEAGFPPLTSGGIRVLNASDLTEIGHQDIDVASGLAESADGSKIWVGSTDSAFQSVVVELDADGNFTGRTVPVGPEPEVLIVSPDGNWIYAPSFANGTLDVVDTSAFTNTATAMVTGDARGVALSADGLRLYSANSASGVEVISIAKLTLTSPASVTPGTGATLFSAQITDGGSSIADYTTNTVKFEILNASNAVVATGTVNPNSSGVASASIDLSTLPVGTYSVRATLDPIAGAVVVTAAGFKVSAAELAATGSNPMLPTAIALLLLLGGATALLVRRRRTA